MNDFLKLITELFPGREYTAETKLKDLEGWSSLNAFVLIMTIDEQLGKAISESDFRKCQTLEDVFKCL